MVKFTELKIKLEFLTRGHLPRWLGSYFYKGVRYHLKKLVCDQDYKCNECKLKGECIYYQIFEKEFGSKARYPPIRPLIFVPPFYSEWTDFLKGQILEVKQIGFRNQVEWTPFIIIALNEMGEEGFAGKSDQFKNRFRVLEIKDYRTGLKVYENDSFYYKNITFNDTDNLSCRCGKEVQIEFPVPFVISKEKNKKITLAEILKEVRLRLINIENEYGTGKKIENFNLEEEIILQEIKRERLLYKRGKINFRLNTIRGNVLYKIKKIDEQAKWLLCVGKHIGGGRNASFGCGFYDYNIIN